MGSLVQHLWAVSCLPPHGGFVRLSMFPKIQRGLMECLECGLFFTKEQAESAFTDHGFDKGHYRVVPVRVTIAEVSEGEALAEIESWKEKVSKGDFRCLQLVNACGL